MSPNGMGREAFWNATRAGTSGIKFVPALDRPEIPAKIAGHIADFDATQFMDERELQHVSRVVPLVLAASGEALADAGIDCERLTLEERRKIAVVLGSGGGSLEFVEKQFALHFSGHDKRCSVYTIPSATLGTIVSEISMRFGLRGFSHLLSTGCASSTDALGYAKQSIQAGVIDTVVVGGADAPISPLIVQAFTLMKILTTAWNAAPGRGSRPFSGDRDGFVVGEGAWMFVLEDYEKARARGAKIYGEISGYGSTCEAYHRVRLDESGEEPARAMEMAMAEAGVEPAQIGYINLHGTATVLNDRIETRAVKRAFGSHAYRLAGSALKSLIGHPQGACGSASVAATLLAMRDDCLPPTINLDVPDPECDLDYIPHTARKLQIEHALCNCIAFGSKNSALVLSRVS